MEELLLFCTNFEWELDLLHVAICFGWLVWRCPVPEATVDLGCLGPDLVGSNLMP